MSMHHKTFNGHWYLRLFPPIVDLLVLQYAAIKSYSFIITVTMALLSFHNTMKRNYKA